MHASERQAAIVFATDFDIATRFTYPTALEVSRLFRSANPTSPIDSFTFLSGPSGMFQGGNLLVDSSGSLHAIRQFQMSDAANQLANEMRALRTSISSEPSHQLRIGFGTGHGSSTGIVPLPGGLVVFDERHAQMFHRGILVLAACFRVDTFPVRLITLPGNPIHAVIGYKPRLNVCTPRMIERIGVSAYFAFQASFAGAIVQPIRSLLAGKTVDEAFNDTWNAWNGIATTSADIILRKLAVMNRSNLSLWGDGNAKL